MSGSDDYAMKKKQEENIRKLVPFKIILSRELK